MFVQNCQGAEIQAMRSAPGRDPQDSNVRIAPSFASAEEIEPAARLFTICVRLATL